MSLSPRTMVSPALLTALVTMGSVRRDPTSVRGRPLTMWLGLRYDRPAVPDQLVPLARCIAEAVKRRQNRPTGLRVRDVLMQFDETAAPTRFSLYAVLRDGQDADLVREWLAGIVKRVPTDLGVADVLEAAPATMISLELIETSYAADVAQLTWRPNQPEPEGAV